MSQSARSANRNRNRNSEMMALTGGSRDVKPQLLSFSASQSANDTSATATQPIAQYRGTVGNGKRMVIEVLKVGYFFPANLTASSSIGAFLSTKSFGTTNTTFAEPTVLDCHVRRSVQATAVGVIVQDDEVWHDLTDGAGNGVLVATDNLFLQVQSSGTSTTNTVRMKVLYRFFAADVGEFVSIIQSQQ